MSLTIAYSVAAEMLTVPGQPACSCEQEMVTGGSSNTVVASPIALATVTAMTVSVLSGRIAPCCSKLPTGNSAIVAPRACSSTAVAVGRKWLSVTGAP
ncbi:hypothetical protein GCM10027436_29960 [Actinophytocola sediminis]